MAKKKKIHFDKVLHHDNDKLQILDKNEHLSFHEKEKEIIKKVYNTLIGLGYPKEKILIDFPMGAGTKWYMSDITVIDDEKKPLLIVEVKRYIDSTYSNEQISKSIKGTNCKVGILTSGSEEYILLNSEMGIKLLSSIPTYDNLLSGNLNKLISNKKIKVTNYQNLVSKIFDSLIYSAHRMPDIRLVNDIIKMLIISELADSVDNIQTKDQINKLICELSKEKNFDFSDIVIKEGIAISILKELALWDIANKQEFVYSLLEKLLVFDIKQSGQFIVPENLSKFVVEQLTKSQTVNKFAFLSEMFSTIPFRYKGVLKNPTITLNSKNISMRELFFLYNFWGDQNLNFEDIHNQDLIIAFPPFGLKTGGETELDLVNNYLNSLGKSGKLIVSLSSGVLFNRTKKYMDFRKNILENYVLESIIYLPNDTFYGTSIQSALLTILNKTPNKNNVLLVKAEEENISSGDGINEIIKDPFSEFMEVKQNKLDYNNLTFGFYKISKKIQVGKFVKLKDIAEIISGVNESKPEKDLKGKNKIIKISDIQFGEILLDKNQSTLQRVNEKFIIQNNDILLSTKGTLGKVAFSKDNNHAFPSSGLVIIRPVKIDPRYLFSILQSDLVKEQINAYNSGTVINYISKNNIENIRIPYPSILQKKKISEEMDVLEKELKETEIRRKDILKKLEKFKKEMHEMVFKNE